MSTQSCYIKGNDCCQEMQEGGEQDFTTFHWPIYYVPASEMLLSRLLIWDFSPSRNFAYCKIQTISKVILIKLNKSMGIMNKSFMVPLQRHASCWQERSKSVTLQRNSTIDLRKVCWPAMSKPSSSQTSTQYKVDFLPHDGKCFQLVTSDSTKSNPQSL